MDAQELVRHLQAVLRLSVKTGQITLNLREGRLETFETRTFARLASDHKALDQAKGMSPD